MNYKNIIQIITILAMICFVTIKPINAAEVQASEDDSISIGTYIQLGKYNDEPIIWKCIDIDDENGILMLSDKILCYKAYNAGKDSELKLDNNELGNEIWENSSIRIWLNSTDESGCVPWKNGNIPDENHVANGKILSYDKESGFMSDNNFTETERYVMKSISQWQILGSNYAQLSTNGVKFCFQTNYYPPPYVSRYGVSNGFMVDDVSQLNHIEGAMYRLTDTVFLPDESQIYKLWSNFGTVSAISRETAYDSVKNYPDANDPYKYTNSNLYNGYCLRASIRGVPYVYNDAGYSSSFGSYIFGIRPAFYLNENNCEILSGSGTETDPYVVDGKAQEGTVVFSQGEQLTFDQEPIEENGRLLVPVRAIFESLGAEVTYDDGDGVITANDGERTVVMQIDNPEMGNGTEVFTLDVVPQIVGDRTLVPLRAVSKAFDCTVDYIENLNRVVIDKPKLPMDFGERPEKPKENWQREDFEKNFPGWEPF